MFVVLVSVFISFQIYRFGVEAVAVAPTASKNGSSALDNKIIDHLKEDLKKDNDDYQEMTSKASVASSLRPGVPTLQGNINRRVLYESSELAHRPWYGNALRRTQGPQPGAKPYPKLVNKDKLDRIVKFIDKYKVLVTKLMEIKTTPKGSGPASLVARTFQGDVKARAGIYGKEAHGDVEPENRVPNMHELDMAPAIGGRIHSLRIKNRLCQRYVMNPEGPKYDSKGRLYLREFSLTADGKQFQQTRSPHLVLPKCCNCCAKSVLGCE